MAAVKDEVALLVDYVSVKEGAETVPPRHAWIVFPRNFKGLKVYYRRGQRIVAHD